MAVIMIIYGAIGAVFGHVIHKYDKNIRMAIKVKVIVIVFIFCLVSFFLVYQTKLFGLNFLAAGICAFLEVRFSTVTWMIIAIDYKSSFTAFNTSQALKSYITSIFIVIFMPGVFELGAVLGIVIVSALILFVMIFRYKG